MIEGSVILPLLPSYPEDPSLESLAATLTFQVSILGRPAVGAAPHPSEENPAG